MLPSDPHWRCDGTSLVFSGVLPGNARFAVSLRGAGDLGPDGDAPARARWLEGQGVDGARLAWCRQVHGDGLVVAGTDPPGREADGLLDPVPAGTIPLAVFAADCLGVALVSAAGPRALVHSGWRGTRAGIAARAVARLGVAPEPLTAVFGPAAHGCCYRVGEEFRRDFPARWLYERDGVLFFDNQGAVREQLLAAGLAAENIFLNPYCTICHNTVCYSYRTEGRAAGRMLHLLHPSR